jgi:hypothetical protein
MAIEFVLRLRYPLLQVRDTLLEIRCFDGAQLQVHEERQAGRDPGMNSAGVNIRDQASHRIPHRQRIVQGRQRIHPTFVEFLGKELLPVFFPGGSIPVNILADRGKKPEVHADAPPVLNTF